MNNIAAIEKDRTTPTSSINLPDITVKAREVFGIESDLEIAAF